MINVFDEQKINLNLVNSCRLVVLFFVVHVFVFAILVVVKLVVIISAFVFGLVFFFFFVAVLVVVALSDALVASRCLFC